MTENETSPDNLRKFLESDDPAMVMMGLSMAKGSGVPDELLPIILRFYMWDDDKTVRAAAKSVFNKHAPNDVKTKVKENWKASYRTLTVTEDEFKEAVRPFLEAFKSQDNFSIIALESLIKALGDKERSVCTAKALGEIGDKRAVKPLIKALRKGNHSAAIALNKIGDKRAVEPLIKILNSKDGDIRNSAVDALGEIGDKRAVEPLIKALKDKKGYVRQHAASALGNIGDKRAVEPLIKSLEDKTWSVRKSAVKALGNIVDKRAVEPLIKALGDEVWDVRERAGEALVKIGDCAVELLIKALRDKDEVWDVRESAVYALGKIGDKRAVEPLIKALGDDDYWRARKSAAEALEKLGHEVE